MILTYAIKSAITLALLYFCMMPIFDKETFHRFNRLLAIGSILFSLLLPFVHIQRDGGESFVGKIIEVPASFSVVISGGGEAHVAQVEAWSWGDVATMVYLTGVFVVVFVAIVQSVGLMRNLRYGTHIEDGQGNTIVLHTGKVSPYCFFRYIVMSVDDYEHYRQFILTHEQEHIRLHHYVDLVILAIATALQWFNPFIWILGKELKAIHEYEADEAVINQGIDATQYQKFLVVKAVGNRLQLFANNLNRGSLKSRILMMNQKKSSRWMLVKAIAIIPVALLAVNVFAIESTSAIPSSVTKIASATKIASVSKIASANKVTPSSKVISVPKVTSGSKVVPAPKSFSKKENAREGKDGELTGKNNKKMVETMPEFPGGEAALMAFLMSKVKYPESALTANVQGKSIVGFVVKKDGHIANVVINKSAGSKLLDEEAMRVVKLMPRWNPGTQDGKPVEVKYSVPLIFRLN